MRYICHSSNSGTEFGVSVQAFSYVSPNALLKAAFPDQKGPEQADVGPEGRIAAFKQYISDKEKRATMQLVPDFPSGLTWFNSSPLSMQR